MEPKGKNAPGHADRRLGGFERNCVSRSVLLEQFLRRCCPIEFVRIGFVPARFNFGELFLALEKLVDRVKR